MAKAYVATLEGDYSDIVLGRVVAFGDTGWNFKEVEVTWAEDTFFAGLLMKADGTAAAVADAANVYGVLVDRKVLPGVEQFKNGALVAGEKVPMVLAVRGLTLNQTKLFFADKTTVINAAAIAKLEANANQVTAHVVGTEFIGSVL